MNPFENPELISKEVNEEIVNLIKDLISKKQLDFFKMLSYFEDKILKKDIIRSKISAYYCTNVILSSNKTNSEKMELIRGIKEELDNLINN